MKDGRVMEMEFKAQDGRLRPEQSIFLERIRDACGLKFAAGDCRDIVRQLGGLSDSCLSEITKPDSTGNLQEVA